jgi:hypothetical protein
VPRSSADSWLPGELGGVSVLRMPKQGKNPMPFSENLFNANETF